MKRVLFILAFMCLCTAAMGQSYQLRSDLTKEEIRERIGIDSSIPDFNTKKIDEAVIGHRLAQILLSLKDNYEQSLYNRILARIADEQTKNRFSLVKTIDAIEIPNIRKDGDVITISVRLLTKVSRRKMDGTDIKFVFYNGVSESGAENTLFMNLARYLED